MRESSISMRGHWPFVEVPKDLLAYFASEQLIEHPNDEIDLYDRERFLEQLDEHMIFGKFWEHIHEQYPQKSEYFASLTDEQMPFEPDWIEKEYYRYLYNDDFGNLSEAKRMELQVKFDKIRPDAYQAALKGEAIRLNCAVSEVRPDSLVLPLAPGEGNQLKLADLPESIFIKIMDRLDSLDCFKLSLVCRCWQNMMHNNGSNLRRAEHAKTTHLITFTDWLDPVKTPCLEMFEHEYRQFSWGLIRWCCGITALLETVILDQPIPSFDAVAFLWACPHLKNLQIECDFSIEHLDGDGSFSSEVSLPKLEFYYSRNYNTEYKSELDTKVLFSCKSLRYFGGQLKVEEVPPIEIQDRMKLAFRNLVALDLEDYTFEALEILADVDDLRLRYFGLGEAPIYDLFDDNDMAARLQTLLGRILPKLKMLEILKVSGSPGIRNSTIKLLTELKLKLKTAVFLESVFHVQGDYMDTLDDGDYWETEVLEEFGQMLLSNDSGLDLSKFYFIVLESTIAQEFREENLGFTFASLQGSIRVPGCRFGLNFQSIRRLLGIDF